MYPRSSAGGHGDRRILPSRVKIDREGHLTGTHPREKSSPRVPSLSCSVYSEREMEGGISMSLYMGWAPLGQIMPPFRGPVSSQGVLFRESVCFPHVLLDLADGS